MSKELTPLEALKIIKNIELTRLSYDQDENLDGEWEYTPIEESIGDIEENYPDEIDVIETALKDYELVKGSVCIASSIGLDECRKRDKALEIIKEKGVNVDGIRNSCTLFNYHYYQSNDYDTLTQEEFDLLKEMLL